MNADRRKGSRLEQYVVGNIGEKDRPTKTGNDKLNAQAYSQGAEGRCPQNTFLTKHCAKFLYFLPEALLGRLTVAIQGSQCHLQDK